MASAWAETRALRIWVGCLPCTSKENEEGLLCESHEAIALALDEERERAAIAACPLCREGHAPEEQDQSGAWYHLGAYTGHFMKFCGAKAVRSAEP